MCTQLRHRALNPSQSCWDPCPGPCGLNSGLWVKGKVGRRALMGKLMLTGLGGLGRQCEGTELRVQVIVAVGGRSQGEHLSTTGKHSHMHQWAQSETQKPALSALPPEQPLRVAGLSISSLAGEPCLQCGVFSIAVA